MKYTAKHIAEITNSEIIGDENTIIKNIVFDSRNIFLAHQTAFLAITTHKNSGEKYLQNAIEKGIKIIICEQKPHFIQEEITYIITPNSVAFLHQLAKYHISFFSNLKTIGITGSNGKTIVKEWLYQCLNEYFAVVKSPKSFNSQIGLPISLLQTNENHQIGIFEAGISEPKEMQKLQAIFSPKIGILTHIGTAHISHFETENQLIEEKIRLFQDSETIIFNGDNPLVSKRIKEKYADKNLISYGLGSENDIFIHNNWHDRSEDITISHFGELFSLPVSQRDEATLNNMLCVVALLKILDFDNAKIIDKINHLKSVEMRLESVEGNRNNLIINDSFNLDLDSLVIAYQFVNEYNKPKKVLILTDFAENKNTDLYPKVITFTNEQNFDQIYLIGKEITAYQNQFSAETFVFGSTEELLHYQPLQQIENALILLKGARKFEIERIKNLLELQKHDTLLEINLNSILHNINIHRELLKPETKVMAMVKAFSYGLGDYEIAEFLQHHHIDYFGVAYADEGVSLRKHGITKPIMVMNPEQNSYQTIIEYDLEPEIYSFRVLENFYQALKDKGYSGNYPIHIKLETGMNRLGFKTEDLPLLIQKIRQLPVKVKSIFSHLSSADDETEKEYTLSQCALFEENSNQIIQALDYQPIRHILNSAGIVYYSDYQMDMVRMGIGMLGISPHKNIQKLLQNVVSFKTVISQISQVKKGDSIGYNRKYKTEKNTQIATIPIGYADGIPRLVGNKVGKVKINQQYCNIVGNVCMDMMMIDIKQIPAKEGDAVTIFDTIQDLKHFSEYCQTIPYEVLTSISRRVKRVYIKE